MNSTNSNLTPSNGSATELESRITSALENKPEMQIPQDFAAKVAARAVTQPLRRRRPKPQFGNLIALLSVPLAALALFALAPHAAPNFKSLSFDAEVVLLAELAFIGWWVARSFSPHASRH